MSTATALPFMGGEMGSFDPLDNGIIEDTTAGTFDSAFARCSIHVQAASSGGPSPTWTAAPTFTLAGSVYTTGGALLTLPMIELLNGSTVVCDITQSPSNVVTVRTLQSGTLTAVGTLNVINGLLNRLNIALVSNTASGSCQGYIAGTQVFNVTGLNHAGFTGVTQVRLRGGSGNCYWSEVIGDTVSHVGARLKTYPIDTVSATNTGFTGAVTDVNEIVYSDATFVYATANAQISTYYASGFSLGTYNVRAVAVGCRALRGATGPQNFENAIRVGGTNYTGSSVALNTGYQAVTTSWTTNPNTSATWTASGAQAVEGGMEALT